MYNKQEKIFFLEKKMCLLLSPKYGTNRMSRQLIIMRVGPVLDLETTILTEIRSLPVLPFKTVSVSSVGLYRSL